MVAVPRALTIVSALLIPGMTLYTTQARRALVGVLSKRTLSPYKYPVHAFVWHPRQGTRLSHSFTRMFAGHSGCGCFCFLHIRFWIHKTSRGFSPYIIAYLSTVAPSDFPSDSVIHIFIPLHHHAVPESAFAAYSFLQCHICRLHKRHGCCHSNTTEKLVQLW